MTNVTMETDNLETVLERAVRKMETECNYLLEFWEKNNISYKARSDGKYSFWDKYAGYCSALFDVGLLEPDDVKNMYTYLDVFTSQLTDSVLASI